MSRRLRFRPSILADLTPRLGRLRIHYRGGKRPTISHLLGAFGGKGPLVATLVLALPFLWPLGLGPVTWPFSAMLFLLGLRILRQREETPLPERWRLVEIPRPVFNGMRRISHLAARLRHRERRVLPARHLTPNSRRLLLGGGIIAGALMIAIPAPPFIPLANTIPAIGVLLFALAGLKRNDRLAFAGIGATICAILFFTGLGAAFLLLGFGVVGGTEVAAAGS